MHIIAVIFLSLSSLVCSAEYFSAKHWIEQNESKSQAPQDERIFVGDSLATTNTFIVHFRKGFSLRDAVDLTHYKGADVLVTVWRQHKTQPVFFDVVKQSEKPKFEVKAKDVICIAQIVDIN